MSRIGNKAVEIPDKVKVNVGDGGQVSVEGPKGKLQWTLPREISATVKTTVYRWCGKRKRVAQKRCTDFRAVSLQHGSGSQRRVHEATGNRRRRF
jgi:Ribosomal protein L6P/L9E